MFKSPPPPISEPVSTQQKVDIPIFKETVTIKLDSDVLALFQEDGPGWQEWINNTLRRAAGL